MMATGLGTAITAGSSTAATMRVAATLIIIVAVIEIAMATAADAITAAGAATGIAILVTATDTVAIIGAVDTIRGGDIRGTPMATGMNRRTVMTAGTAIGSLEFKTVPCGALAGARRG